MNKAKKEVSARSVENPALETQSFRPHAQVVGSRRAALISARTRRASSLDISEAPDRMVPVSRALEASDSGSVVSNHLEKTWADLPGDYLGEDESSDSLSQA